jgi:hypothetical protein
MKQGDIILTPVPQADGKLKNRPAIILRDWISDGVAAFSHNGLDWFNFI